MLVGMIWCVLGLALTFISYYYASDGGSFSIFYGSVIYGIYKAVTGLAAHLREHHATIQRQEFVISTVTHVPEYGVTLILPAGFTMIEKSDTHETDSSCASTSLYSSDHGYAYVVDPAQKLILLISHLPKSLYDTMFNWNSGFGCFWGKIPKKCIFCEKCQKK